MTQRLHTRGFTLIEILIYISVLVLATTVVVTAFISLRTIFERNRAQRQVADAATAILERIVRETRNSIGISSIATSTLVLNQAPTTTSFYLSNGDMKVNVQGGGWMLYDDSLDSDRVIVSKVLFSQFTNTGTSTAVKVDLELSVTGPYASTTQTFNTTAVVRGTYE